MEELALILASPLVEDLDGLTDGFPWTLNRNVDDGAMPFVSASEVRFGLLRELRFLLRHLERAEVHITERKLKAFRIVDDAVVLRQRQDRTCSSWALLLGSPDSPDFTGCSDLLERSGHDVERLFGHLEANVVSLDEDRHARAPEIGNDKEATRTRCGGAGDGGDEGSGMRLGVRAGSMSGLVHPLLLVQEKEEQALETVDRPSVARGVVSTTP